MAELKPSQIFWMILVVLAVLVLGDYLGYKIGHWRLATIVGIIALVTVVAFAIYAAVVLD